MNNTCNVTFTLNGERLTVDYEKGMSVLDILREQCNIKSCKDGCSGQGFCGACSVLIDGKARITCTRDPETVQNKNILTIEGFPEEEKELLSSALVKEGAIQCGFCTPGIMIRFKSYLDNNKLPTSREEKAKAISRNLCRCTGYQRILDALETAEEHWINKVPIDIEAPPRRNKLFGEKYGYKRTYTPKPGGIGSNVKRYRGLEMALGKKPYIADMEMERLLHGALLLSEYPRAKVKKIDISTGKKSKGVIDIFTAKDVPGKRKTGHIYPDWPIFVDEGEITRYVGDVLAIVIADSMHYAREAIKKIKVDYEIFDPIADPLEALKERAPPIHETGNLLSETHFTRGDVEETLQNSRYIIKQRFKTQRIEHAFMEVESCLVKPTQNGVHVYSQGQGVHEDQRQIAEVLGLKKENVIVELVSNGGAFGGKEDLSCQAQTAVAAYLLKKPVKLVLTREQSLRMHPKRHPMIMDYEVGADEKGKLTAVKMRLVADTGAYASVGAQVVERSAGHACGVYHVPVVDIGSKAVYTNNVPCGAMRGFGVNQTNFCIETILNMMVEKMRQDGNDIDDFEIRERNVLREGQPFATGQLMEKTVKGMHRCLEIAKPIYKEKKTKKVPIGIACAIKNTGIGNGLADTGRVLIKVLAAEKIEILTGFTEMGQGLFTVLTQSLTEITDIPASHMSVKTISLAKTKCGMTTASRGTALDTMAAKRAAQKLAKALETKTLKELAGEEFHGEYISDFTMPPGTDTENPVTHFAFSYAVQMALLNEHGKLDKIYAIHDVGRAINPLACAGQIEGGVHMGLGHSLSESFPLTNAVPDSLKMRDLQIISARDTPEVEVILVEEPEEAGGFGSKGIGEIGLVPTAGAVAGALYQYDKTWRFELPLTRKEK